MVVNLDNLPIVVVREDSNVSWIPVTYTAVWRSQYKTSEQRRNKPHDFRIEIDVSFTSYLPHELVCTDHYYEYNRTVEIEEERYEPAWALTIEACGLKAKMEFRKIKPAELVRIVKGMCGRKLSRRTIVEWLKVDLGYWFPEQFPEYAKYAQMLQKIQDKLKDTTVRIPYIIKDVISYNVPVKETHTEQQFGKTFESADEFQEKMAKAYHDIITDLIREFMTEEYHMPIAVEFEDLEGGYERLEPEGCTMTTGNVITAPITDTKVIEYNTELLNVSFRRSNVIEVEPSPYLYWTQKLEDFIENNSSKVIDKLVTTYRKIINRGFGKEVVG